MGLKSPSFWASDPLPLGLGCPNGPQSEGPLIQDASDAEKTGARVPSCLQERERSALIIPKSKRFPASVKIHV